MIFFIMFMPQFVCFLFFVSQKNYSGSYQQISMEFLDIIDQGTINNGLDFEVT